MGWRYYINYSYSDIKLDVDEISSVLRGDKEGDGSPLENFFTLFMYCDECRYE